jgi:hypothetical protein
MPRLNERITTPHNEASVGGHEKASEPRTHSERVQRPLQARSNLRTYFGSFALSNGTQGTLHMKAGSSCEVINFVIASFPSLHRCSVRCVQ